MNGVHYFIFEGRERGIHSHYNATIFKYVECGRQREFKYKYLNKDLDEDDTIATNKSFL